MICLLAFLNFLGGKFGFLIEDDRPWIQRMFIFFLGRSLIGFCTALIFWYLVIYAILGGTTTSQIILGLLMILFCLGSLFLKSVRCIFLLMSLQFFGKAGRSAVKTLLFTLVITGPLTNLSKNALEINRVFVCSSQLAYNLSRTHIDLMIFPFRAAIEELQNVTQVRESFRIVDDVVDALEKEVEQDDDESINVTTNFPIKTPESIEENYSKKLSKRCQDQLQKGRDECAEVFANVYSSCNEEFPDFLAKQFCWMMDIENICFSKLNNDTEELCTSQNVLNDSFGEVYMELLQERKQFMDEIESVTINYTYNPFNETNINDNIEVFESYKSDLEDILEEKKSSLKYLLSLTKILFAFTYIKIVIRSFFYFTSFLMELDFENIYITSSFRDIDQNRAERGERTILPLKKLERSTLVADSFEKQRITNDYRDLIHHLLKFLLELIAVTTFILLDWLLVTALEIVAENGKMDFIQKGEVEVNVTVSGDGMMAVVVDHIISGFSVNRTVVNIEDNEKCLPHPSKLSTVFFLKIYGIFLGILLMIYNESYTKRLLFLICAFFYPQRQQERSLFLYNRILLSRKDYFRRMKAMLQHEILEESNFDFPCKKISDVWKMIFPSSRCCRICQEVERKSQAKEYQGIQFFVDCPAQNCQGFYCNECWDDLEGICVLCSSTK